MKFQITITRKDGTMGTYITTHTDVANALRFAARSLDIKDAATLTFHEVTNDRA